ncbi:bifunctional UDP-sugar hydrolase/5'-nucleotidase [Vampirovibrio sp.]|uniref:bifunctional metallophosphatase/5'-nucleotidase n=1 Tax=Vampirovibrio sp. TaxID=2717857 RepID=UPI003592F3F3
MSISRFLRQSVLSISLVGLLGFGALATSLPGWTEAGVAQYPQPIHITLLQLNDVYQLAPDKPSEPGGFARIATLRQRIQAENPHTFLILAGDTLSPSPGAKLFYGKQMIDLWNQVGLDVATLGNHEFDFGNDILLQRIQESRFQWVSANVMDKTTGKPFGSVLPYVIKTVNGVKIGFFGLLTPDTKNASSAGPNVEFKDPTYTACATVSQMRQAGADVIIAITHLTLDEDKRVASNMNHAVAMVMGGHEHTLLQSVVQGTPIYKVGSDARTMGRYDLWLDPETHRLQSMDAQMLPVDQSIPDDPKVAASVQAYLNQIEAGLGETIGQTTVPLNALQADNRSQETNLGNFLADAYRAKLKTDVAVLNGGSIRANKIYPAGPITRKDVSTILQFAGPVLKVEVSGKILKQALENGVSRLGEEAGRFPQVSGLKFVYDPVKPIGSRVLSVSVNGQPLNEGKTYTLATPAYLVLKGGDDYVMLKSAKVLNDPQEALSDSEIVQEAIQQAKTIAPQVEGRIHATTSKPLPNKI